VNWAQIYTDCLPAMTAAAATHVRNRPDLEPTDVVHDAFAAVLADPPPAVPDWQVFLVELTGRLCPAGLDGIPAADDDETAETEDTATIAVRRLTADEVRHRILRVMNYMTERQREITRLRLFEGLSVGEIAAIMDTSSSNISQIVIRCLTKLAPVLTQFDTIDSRDLEGVRPPRRVH
jgi:DNA-directed RNA polymerase specialized sigma24 family protein